ncbi:MAG: long-chain fatty acid--CoA ligase [Verrucomicrobia bacterium]|nr:long-chain fatty acid--CoA ligase [Verrucomicrobiota bacterium]
MNLASAFALAVAQNRDKTAIFWGDDEYSYQRLDQQTSWLADQLKHQHQVRPGERVALWLRNRPEFVVALFAVLRVGAVVVPINNFLKAEEVAYILQDAGVRVLITESDLGAAAHTLASRIPGLELLRVEGVPSTIPDQAPHEEPLPPRQASDLAFIIYTSGTTGKPKGAMLTHGNLMHNVASCRQVLETVQLDGFVVLLPMFHSFMLCVGILLPLTTGCSILLIKSLHPLKSVIEEIMRGRGTILPAIPQFFRTMAATHQVPTHLPLRLCISGAAPLPVETLRMFGRKFPFPLVEGYGLSEASPVVSINPIHGKAIPGSIGLPVPGVEVTVQDETGQILPPREVGELCVRGGNVMLGYWNQPTETDRALREGWLLTGDIGYQDEEGYFYITDRKKDMLLVNGINVYPREIEEIIYEFPGVREAAVIGRPDHRRGEQPVAYVTAEDGIPLDTVALTHFLRQRLADFKVPRQIEILSALPRNASGKILKTALRDLPGVPD